MFPQLPEYSMDTENASVNSGPTWPPKAPRINQTSELSLVTIYDEPNLLINDRRAKAILNASALLTVAAGVTAMIAAGIILDSGYEVEEALGGWNIRLIGLLVFLLGFAVFIGGFVGLYNIHEGNMKIVYGVAMIIALCLIIFLGIAFFKLLADVNQEAEGRTNEAFKKLNDTTAQKAILKLQFNNLCCGLHGPSYYDKWPGIPVSCCGVKSFSIASDSPIKSTNCTKRRASQIGCVEVVKSELNRVHRAATTGLLSIVLVEILTLLVDYVVLTRGEWLFNLIYHQN